LEKRKYMTFCCSTLSKSTLKNLRRDIMMDSSGGIKTGGSERVFADADEVVEVGDVTFGFGMGLTRFNNR
jgi:hypothetical protein